MRQFLDVIRAPEGNEAMRIVGNIQPADGSVLLVPAGCTAFVVINGHVSDEILPGRYDLKTGVKPFFRRVSNFMTGGDTGIEVSVFFVAKDIYNWTTIGIGEIPFSIRRGGTQITMRAMGSVRIAYCYDDPSKLLSRVVGMYARDTPDVGDVEAFVNSFAFPIVRQTVSRELGNCDITDINNNLDVISNSMFYPLNSRLHDAGITLKTIEIQGINIDRESLERYERIEETYVTNIAQTDAERYALTTIYGGNIDKRIEEEMLTSSVRGAGAAVVNNGNNIANMYAQIRMADKALNGVLEGLTERHPDTSHYTRRNDDAHRVPPMPGAAVNRPVPPPMPGQRNDEDN